MQTQGRNRTVTSLQNKQWTNNDDKPHQTKTNNIAMEVWKIKMGFVDETEF